MRSATSAEPERLRRDPLVVNVQDSCALSRGFGVPYDERYAFSMGSLAKLRNRDIVDFIDRNATIPSENWVPATASWALPFWRSSMGAARTGLRLRSLPPSITITPRIRWLFN